MTIGRRGRGTALVLVRSGFGHQEAAIKTLQWQRENMKVPTVTQQHTIGHMDLLVGPRQCSVSAREARLPYLLTLYRGFGSCPQEGTMHNWRLL